MLTMANSQIETNIRAVSQKLKPIAEQVRDLTSDEPPPLSSGGRQKFLERAKKLKGQKPPTPSRRAA